MDYIEYTSKLKEVQKKLLNFIDYIDNVEENYENFTKYLVEQNKIDIIKLLLNDERININAKNWILYIYI